MSDENLEVVRGFLEAAEQDDLPSALACLDPDLEWIPRRAPIEGAYRGHAGYEQFVADTWEIWETFELHFDLRPLDDGRVFAWGTIRARGAGSGAEMDVPVGGVFDFRNGRIARWHDFGSKEKALEALGLRG